MKKTILITLAPLLIIDAYVSTGMNYKNMKRTNETTSAQQIKSLHDPKTSLVFSDNPGTGKDILLKTPPLYKARTRHSTPSSPRRIEVKVFF